jgi:hypothetical protein
MSLKLTSRPWRSTMKKLLRLLKTFMKMFAFMKFLATICDNLFGFEEKKTIK